MRGTRFFTKVLYRRMNNHFKHTTADRWIPAGEQGDFLALICESKNMPLPIDVDVGIPETLRLLISQFDAFVRIQGDSIGSGSLFDLSTDFRRVWPF